MNETNQLAMAADFVREAIQRLEWAVNEVRPHSITLADDLENLGTSLDSLYDEILDIDHE